MLVHRADRAHRIPLLLTAWLVRVRIHVIAFFARGTVGILRACWRAEEDRILGGLLLHPGTAVGEPEKG